MEQKNLGEIPFVKGSGRLSIAYVATLLLPWALIFNRATADICGVLIGILWLWQSYEQKDWNWLQDSLVRIGLLAWVWLVVVVSPFAISPGESFAVAVPWIRYILLFVALRYWVLTNAQSISLLGKILAIMLALLMIDTFWQYIFGVSLTGHIRSDGGRLSGPMDNVKVGIFTAKMLFPTVGIGLFFAVQKKQYIWGIASLLLLVFGEIIILLSGERTAFISSIIVLSSIIILLTLAERRMRVIAPLFMLLLGAIFFFLLKTQSWVMERATIFIDTLSGFGESVYGKLFKAANMIGEEYWFSGVGLKGFRILCDTMEKQGLLTYCNLHPHNTYLEWFAEAGVPGLFFYCALVIVLFATSLRCFYSTTGIYRLLPAVSFGAILINFFPFMVTQSIFSNWPAILLWYSLAVAFSAMNIVRSSSGKEKT